MRSTTFLLPLAMGLATGVMFVATIFLSPDFALANEGQNAGSQCTCPGAEKKSTRPKFAELNTTLDDGDEVAALESVQFALSRIGDKQTYVWHRNNGHLSGIVQPTASFHNADGAVCRHLVVLLTTGLKTRKTEGIACRLVSGIWQLEG